MLGGPPGIFELTRAFHTFRFHCEFHILCENKLNSPKTKADPAFHSEITNPAGVRGGPTVFTLATLVRPRGAKTFSQKCKKGLRSRGKGLVQPLWSAAEGRLATLAGLVPSAQHT